MSPPRARRRPRLLAMLAGVGLAGALLLAGRCGPSPASETASDAPSHSAAQASPASEVSPGAIEVHAGHFESAGQPVETFSCAPLAPGAHPAVIILHGAVPRGFGVRVFADMCRGIAANGYYAMYLEYYSQAGPAQPGDPSPTGKEFAPWVNRNFPVWTREIADGIDALGKNPAVLRDRIALLGQSLGAFLALAAGASEGGRVAAVVDYYGGMNGSYAAKAANMPPTLILHGGADATVPVRYAYELDALLARYNRPHEMKIYPGAGHGLDPASSADAWRTTLDFLRRYLGRRQIR